MGCFSKKLLLVCFNYLLLLFFLTISSGCFQQKIVRYKAPQHQNSTQLAKDSKRQKDVQAQTASELKMLYEGWKGVKYRRGGTGRTGIDCSGFTALVYRELYEKNLPRTVEDQVKQGKTVSKENLKTGDLVFFKTGLFSRHVGVYSSDNRFVHASYSKGVMQSNLSDSYWRKRYWVAKRL